MRAFSFDITRSLPSDSGDRSAQLLVNGTHLSSQSPGWLYAGTSARLANKSMPRPNDQQRVLDHYNRVSPYYHTFWGEHLHHGYWIHGGESKETAQVQLVEHLAQAADIQPRAKILDIGCGFGASSIYLARKYQADVTGITISPLQVEMANQAAAAAGASSAFACMDAERMSLSDCFDVLWSIESISHYQDVPRFFANAAKLLNPGGTFALTDWFKQLALSPGEHKKFLSPIEDGMLVELHTMHDYENYLASAGLLVTRIETLNQHTAKTWDLCLDIIKDKSFWELAARHGSEFIRFLRAFKAMRAGFSSGHFVYGLLIAHKPAFSY
jgi:tocopherol O-methyltransferase